MSTTDKTEDHAKVVSSQGTAPKPSKSRRDAGGIGAASLLEAPIRATADASRVLSGKDMKPADTSPPRTSTAKRVLINLRAAAQKACRKISETG